MRPLASNYPLGQFLIHEVERSGSSLDNFILRLGYKNLARGRNDFYECLRHGCVDTQFLDHLRSTLSDKSKLDCVLEETIAILQCEGEAEVDDINIREQTEFTPYIALEYQQVFPCHVSKDQLFMANCLPNFLVPIELLSIPREEQLKCLKELIQEHFRNNAGLNEFNECICGYRWFYIFDDWIQFDTNGDPLDEECASP